MSVRGGRTRSTGRADDADGETTVGSTVAVDDPAFARIEAGLVLDDLLRLLQPRDQRIIELRFHDDLPQSQIGELVGLSQMQVSRSLRDSLATLQKAVDESTFPPW